MTAAEAIADDSRIDLAVSAISHGNGTEPIALQLLENGKPIEVRRVAPTPTASRSTPSSRWRRHGDQPWCIQSKCR